MYFHVAPSSEENMIDPVNRMIESPLAWLMDEGRGALTSKTRVVPDVETPGRTMMRGQRETLA